jgi:electron transfer flavoprotein beta subunit
MDILVCVKQVPDDVVKVHLNESGKPAVAAIPKIVNSFDAYGVEMALRLCETHGGKVVVATIGEENEVRPSMVQMIAVGANQAYIYAPVVTDADENATADGLAQLVNKCEESNGAEFDLIMCGKESTDEISSAVGAMLAEKLNLGFVSNVVNVEFNLPTLYLKQETEEGYAIYETPAPAVVTVAKPNYEPRYPSLKSKMAARKAEIPYISGVLTRLEPTVKCLRYLEPAPRNAGIKINEQSAAEAVAKAIEKLRADKVL